MDRMNRICVWLLGLALALVVSSCNDELETDLSTVGESVDWVLPFNAEDNFKIKVSSRATLPEDREKKIYNFYVYIFTKDGKKLYGHYFDSDNLRSAQDAGASGDWWESSSVNFDKGKIHIKTNSASECSVYALTNIDVDMVNITPQKLDRLQTVTEVEGLISTMNQHTVARNGYFPMSAKIESVEIASDQATATGKSLQFRRLDAKVAFNVFVGDPNPGKQPIKEFLARSWQVINVPKGSFVFPQNGGAVSDHDYFDTEAVNFEGKTVMDQKVGVNGEVRSVTTNQFSFYMVENLTTVKSDKGFPKTQADRSRRNKNADGTNADWMYAPTNATFVIIKGRVVMDEDPRDPNSSTIGSTLNADVTYIIHLGDFAKDVTDFSVKRNTAYTFNVKIKGVDDIRLEVETNGEDEPTENAPGAMGDVTIAKEEIYDCDAHYTSHVLTFHAKNINPDQVTWYVKTPFSEGKPTIINGVEVPNALDYKWVHFQKNEINPNDSRYYDQRRKKYDPKKCMDVQELVKYLRDQTRIYQEDPHSNAHDFDKTAEKDGGPRICITAHVDEYYYELNPITGQYEKDLAKRFVNQPMRVMHILSDSEESKDKESLVVGSSSTIQQRSIQTIYNPKNPNLHSAWGCEYWDEYPVGYLEHNESWYYDKDSYTDRIARNTDQMNGRLNSCKEWDLVDLQGKFQKDVRWDKYMDFEVENTTPLLKEQYRYLRYSCMTRNRDNNANGIIDEDEVRWYMASIRQLVGLWMGADGISNNARLYTKEGQSLGGKSWRQHVISSTTNDKSNSPILVWAEEGSSTGPYLESLRENYGAVYSVRCVRNLGETKEGKDITTEPISTVPQDYITRTDHPDGSFTLDMTYLNEESIRYFTSHELDFGDENSMQNRLYKRFKAARKQDHKSFNSINIRDMNAELDRSLTSNRFCPPGYRLPNQRELTVMVYYLDDEYWQEGQNGTGSVSYCRPLTRTRFSFAHLVNSNPFGYWYDRPNMRIGPAEHSNTTKIRCVKDVP